MARSLFVPIHLHARLVTTATAACPTLAPSPFSDTGPALAPGVHLHWALPDALTRGTVDTTTRELRFPAVPDRWLVIRFSSAPPPATVQFEPPPRTCTTFVVDAKHNKSDRLGKLTFGTSSDWLTVMGLLPNGIKTANSPPLAPDVHLQAAYYPTASNRFGFHDTLADLGAYDPQALHLSYLVIGHYRSPNEDPLARLPDPLARLDWISEARLEFDLPIFHLIALTPTHDDPTRAARKLDPALVTAFIPGDGKQKETPPRPLTALAELHLAASPTLLASLADAKKIRAATAEVTAQFANLGLEALALGSVPEDSSGVPARLVCHGAVVDLGPAGAYNTASDLTAPTTVSLADSASQAIEEAFLAIGGGELFAVLRGGLDGEIAGVTGVQSLPHLLHAAGFDAAAPAPTNPPAPPVLEYVATIRDSGSPADVPGIPASATVRIADRRTKGGPPVLVPGLPGQNFPAALAALRAAVAPAIVAVTATPVAPPRWHRPATPVLHFEGQGRSFRHGHDGRMRPDGRLHCRAGGQTITTLELTTDTPSGYSRILAPRLVASDPALAREPDFVRALIHETVLLDPTNRDIAAGAWLAGVDPAARTQPRIDAARDAFSGAAESWWTAADPTALTSAAPGKYTGTLPAAFAVTPWRDPWLPLFAEIDYTFTPDTPAGAALEFDPTSPLEPRSTLRKPGPPIAATTRQALSAAPPATLQSAIKRVQEHFGKVPERKAQLDDLVVRLASLDMLMLGLGDLDPQLRAAGHAVRSGTLAVKRLRLVDSFGQVRDLPFTPRLLSPRLTHWARIHTRLVGPDSLTDADPLRSPLCGCVIFDALEMALEVFDPAGAALGQIRHDRQTHKASWEPAPGRDGVALASVQPTTLAGITTALLAPPPANTSESAAMAAIRVLAVARTGVARRLASDDPRSQLLRRPVLLMRARLTLQLAGIGASDRPDPGKPTLKPGPIAVRLGSLDQADDGLLGFFYKDTNGAWRLHVVPAIATDAWQPQQLVHPIVDRSASLALTPDVPTDVILLLDGPAPFHVQSGLLPRKRIDTSELVPPRTLAQLRSTLRIGPVVMDPSQRRLAAPSLPGETWRWIEQTATDYADSPLAAFSPALSELPERPVTIREGWLRLDPDGT